MKTYQFVLLELLFAVSVVMSVLVIVNFIDNKLVVLVNTLFSIMCVAIMIELYQDFKEEKLNEDVPYIRTSTIK